MSDALRKILEDEWQKHRPPIAMGERRLALCVAAMQRAVDQETEKRRARVKELEAAGNDLLALIDEGYLVRNIRDDYEPGFALRQLPYVQRLARAASALKGDDDGRNKPLGHDDAEQGMSR